jgi:hypothetical protein
LPPDPVIVRAAPEECLFYLSWNGMAKPDPKSANQTEQLLAEAEIQKFAGNVVNTIDAALDEAVKDNAENAWVRQRFVPLVKVFVRRPMALYVSKITVSEGSNGENENPVEGGLIVSLGDEQAAVRSIIGEIMEKIKGDETGKVEVQTLGGFRFTRISGGRRDPILVWAIKDGYLLVGVGQGSAATLVARFDAKAKPATWLARLRSKLPVDRPAMTGFVNAAALVKLLGKNVPDPKFAATVRALGLDSVKSLAIASGLDKQGILSQTLLEIEGEPRGAFKQLNARPLSAADLRPIPKDAVMAGAVRLDLHAIYAQVQQCVQQIDAAAHQEMQQGIARAEEQLGIKLDDDLFKGLGDAWCFYSAATPGALMGGTAAIVVSVRDKAGVQRAHDALLSLAQQALAAEQKPPIEIKEETVGPQRFHYVQIKQPFAPVSPAWCLTDTALVISTTPDGVKSYLAGKGQGGSLAELPEVAPLLRSDRAPLAVGYLNTAEILKTGYPALQLGLMMAGAQMQQAGSQLSLPPLPALDSILPHARPSVSVTSRTKDGLLIQHRATVPGVSVENLSGAPAVMAGLLLPAIQAAREAARRNVVSNEMRQIGIAFMNHAVAHGDRYPAAANYDKEGKALLSWRVHVLPYLEQKALYDQFRLDEPWDSEHNKKLLPKMPNVYADPNDPNLAKAGKTRLLVPTGKAAIFDGKEGPKITSITDGTANTIMAVEVHPDKAVEWTKPDDLEIDPAQPLKGLERARANGFQALFADGSVRLIADNIDLVVLRAMFTPRGGEAVQVP